jgi:hypothetical protein
MEIGPSNPVVTQFRMTTWSPGTADSSAQTEQFKRNSWSDGTQVGVVIAKTGTPPDTDRPVHKLRTALGLSTIPPVTVELPERSPTQPASTSATAPDYAQGGIPRGASPGMPLGGDGGLMSRRVTPPSAGNSQPAFGQQASTSLPESPGAFSAGRPALPTEATQQLKQALVRPPAPGLPESGPMSQGRPSAPLSDGLMASGIDSYARLSPPLTSGLPPLPAAEAPEASTFEDGTPRTADDAADLSQTRARIKRTLAQRATVIEGNQMRRTDTADRRVEQRHARVAREAGAPPAFRTDKELIARHTEPPFDPKVRADLSAGPRTARGLVARKDSVLYDQVGSSIRLEAASRHSDKVAERQRDVGRRAFEVRHRRNAEGVQQSEARNNARQLLEIERLQASEREEITARAEARQQAIQRDFIQQQQTRDTARSSFNARSESRGSTFQDLVTRPQRHRERTFNANTTSRAEGIAERQRDVFELQLQFSEQRRFAQANPVNTVGDESLQTLEFSRTGAERFKEFKADSGAAIDQGAERRAEEVTAKANDTQARETQGADQAQERTQNVRRRLASTYRAPATSAGESRGTL